MSIVITGFLVVLLLLRIPVSLAILVSASAGLWWVAGYEVVLGVLTTALPSSVAMYEFVTIPMFLLMAQFVIISGVATGIFNAAAASVGRWPGGLGVATVLAGAGFGAICHSSTASAATLSATSLPAMIKEGYEPRFAYGVVSISGTLAMLIPPGVAMIIYGLVANVSIGALIIAAIIPAIVIVVTIILTIFIIVALDPKKAPPITHYTSVSRKEATKGATPMVLLFGAVTAVIYTGIATPTEAAAIGAMGAFLVAAVLRRVNVASATRAAYLAAETTCMVLMIITAAHVLSYFLALTNVTQDLIDWVKYLEMPRWGVLLVVYAIYLILGCFLDLAAILVLTVPVVLPVLKTLGYDPIWFGILAIVIAEVGLVHPPAGLNLFIIARATNQPVGEIFHGVWPHIVAHMIAIAILTIFPELALWLPSTMMK
jgi:tripartite ATP-independent transporter DctM subunit